MMGLMSGLGAMGAGLGNLIGTSISSTRPNRMARREDRSMRKEEKRNPGMQQPGMQQPEMQAQVMPQADYGYDPNYQGGGGYDPYAYQGFAEGGSADMGFMGRHLYGDNGQGSAQIMPYPEQNMAAGGYGMAAGGYAHGGMPHMGFGGFMKDMGKGIFSGLKQVGQQMAPQLGQMGSQFAGNLVNQGANYLGNKAGDLTGRFMGPEMGERARTGISGAGQRYGQQAIEQGNNQFNRFMGGQQQQGGGQMQSMPYPQQQGPMVRPQAPGQGYGQQPPAYNNWG